MAFQFGPENPIIRLCLQGMAMDAEGKQEAADAFFRQAWEEAAEDSGRFYAAFFLSRRQTEVLERKAWLDRALKLALGAGNPSVESALPTVYTELSTCSAELGDSANAEDYARLADSARRRALDEGPFYHGTKAALAPGEMLTAGGQSNYQQDLRMNHVYFTALPNGAGLAAELAQGEGPGHVYLVEPTGPFEDDPNVTDKKFPGNPTRSYRTREPLRIVAELEDWARRDPDEIRQWRENLAKNKGKIIN